MRRRERAGETATGNRTPIDGRYRIHTTAADLRAAGTPESDINPGNYGSYEVILDRGRFSIGPPKNPTAVGTCTVVGNTVTLTISHGAGGRGSSKPGERFDFRWSRYRDQLTLSPVKGKSSPEPLLAKPWRRIGTRPSASIRRRCSRHCAGCRSRTRGCRRRR